MDDIKDSIKEWVGARLSSPYFASVIVVWLFFNRVVIFGLFNFHEDDKLSERIAWVQNELSNQHFWGLNGVDAGLIRAFVLGLLIMLIYELVSTITTTLYALLTKITNKVKASVIPDWYSKAQVEKIIKENQEKITDLDNGYKTLMNIKNETDRKAAIAEESANSSKLEYAKLKKEKDTALENIIEKGKVDEKKIGELADQIVENRNIIQRHTNLHLIVINAIHSIGLVNINSASYAITKGREINSTLRRVMLEKGMIESNAAGITNLTDYGRMLYEYTEQMKLQGELVDEVLL